MQSLRQNVDIGTPKADIVATKQAFACKKTPRTSEQSSAPVGAGGVVGASQPPSSPAGRDGLVYSQTSDTPPKPLSERIALSPTKTRLAKIKSSVLTAARLHCETKKRWRVVMVTPTYAPDSNWNPLDITNLCKCIRQWLGRRGIEFRYVWVLEYTKKGKPHYHMLVWLPLGTTLPHADKRGWWTKGWTNQEWAKNAIGYIAKYASKGSDLIQYRPRARHHGNGGMTGDALLEQRWWKLPMWLRPTVEPSERVQRRKGGGFLHPATGQVFESPWEVIFERGTVFIKRKEQTA